MEGRHRDVGLFRYSLIRDPASPELSKAERGAMVRALAEATHAGPDGERVRVGRSTIDGWIRDWRVGGFEALVPRPRRMEPRTPAQVLGLAEALKKEVPGRTAAQVRRIMDATGDNEVCSS
ncbi:MAG: helix-turn-helix domain-containing protein, partial [Acidimicrobiales bacterium]